MERLTGIAEQARRLFSGPIQFLKSAPGLEHLPDPSVPEISFAGRSNVGKSSLINAVTNRKGLARASNTPGRTQELNYFDVGRQTGDIVVRVLKGESPGDIPVTIAKGTDLFVNKKAAAKMGVTLSDDLIKRAKKVIE